MPDMREIDSCEVCGATELACVLDLGSHPMCDDLVPVGSDRVCDEYPIQILYCAACSTAHQRFQVPKQQLFPETYHYRARHTADVLNGMKDLVSECEARLGPVKGRRVLDIGCNDGSLLSAFRARGAETFGIEPTNAAADAAAEGHTVVQAFFDPAIAERFVELHGQPDIITFTNVFAHIEDLKAVLAALGILMRPDTVLVVENHYLGAVLERGQFDTFYHEHPRTYSFRSFERIAQSLGRPIRHVGFPKRYGGNIRVMIGGDAPADAEDMGGIRNTESRFGEGLRELAKDVETWKKRKKAQIDAAVARWGALPAKAFPGRSAISVKLLELDENAIDRVYEKPTSQKVGHYVPGTRIPIASDDDFDPARHEGPILNLAWHIAPEIEAYMRGRGFKGEFIHIIAAEDFAPDE